MNRSGSDVSIPLSHQYKRILRTRSRQAIAISVSRQYSFTTIVLIVTCNANIEYSTLCLADFLLFAVLHITNSFTKCDIRILFVTRKSLGSFTLKESERESEFFSICVSTQCEH